MFNKSRIKFFPGTVLKRFKSDFARKVFLLKQYEATIKRIWGLELGLKSLQEGREIVRREYDKLTEDVDAATIAMEKAEVKETKEKFEGMIETKRREIEEWKKKIDQTDETLESLGDQIDGFRDSLEKLEQEVYNV